MRTYSEIHAAPLDQLIYWWDPPEFVSSDLEVDDALDEVAYALCQHGEKGLEILKDSLGDNRIGGGALRSKL